MMWENRAYHEAVQGYGKRDAFLALLIFLILMLLLYGQGWLYTTNLPLSVMASLNILTGLCSVGMAVTLVWLSGKRMLGLQRRELGKSLAVGALLAVGLVGSLALVQGMVFDHALQVQWPSVLNMVIFFVGVLNEEIVFRGILQTRLRGLIPWGWLCSILTAGLFLLSHYPVRWGVSGMIDFSSVTGLHVCYILLLHFACSGVYRRTNCLWGAMLLHFVYNIGSGMLVFV